MALIQCPECGKEISDKAPACIHCGFPLQQQSNTAKIVVNISCDKLIQFIQDRANYFMSNVEEYNKETALYIFEVKPKIEELIVEAEHLEQLGDTSLWNKLAITIARIDKQTAYYSGWGEHKKLFEFIDFSKIQLDGQKEIMNVILKSFEDELFGGTNHITYWYPIYQLLIYGTEENKAILNNYLSVLNNTQKQTRYDDLMEMINENLGTPNLLPIKNNTINSIQNTVQNLPKCPTCQSTNIKKVSTASKAGSVFMWGLLSQKVKKQWHCNNCGYEW